MKHRTEKIKSSKNQNSTRTIFRSILRSSSFSRDIDFIDGKLPKMGEKKSRPRSNNTILSSIRETFPFISVDIGQRI